MRGWYLYTWKLESDLVDLPSHRVRVSFSATNNEHHCPLYLKHPCSYIWLWSKHVTMWVKGRAFAITIMLLLQTARLLPFHLLTTASSSSSIKLDRRYPSGHEIV